jgi:hypothetical protein
MRALLPHAALAWSPPRLLRRVSALAAHTRAGARTVRAADARARHASADFAPTGAARISHPTTAH